MPTSSLFLLSFYKLKSGIGEKFIVSLLYRGGGAGQKIVIFQDEGSTGKVKRDFT